MPLLKQRRARNPRRSGYTVFKKRSRTRRLYALILLAALLLVGLGAYHLSSNAPEETSGGSSEQASAPAAQQQAPEETTAEETSSKAPPVPDDPTLYLTVPRLGLYNNTVRNDRSEAALDLGAVKLPETSFPWQQGDTNTYIACHRLGWPGNESYHQCLNLPSLRKGDAIYLTDANGTNYEYQVSEFLQVSPNDIWVADPASGREMVSLQTCIERPGDFTTLGPNWTTRFVVRADRVG